MTFGSVPEGRPYLESTLPTLDAEGVRDVRLRQLADAVVGNVTFEQNDPALVRIWIGDLDHEAIFLGDLGISCNWNGRSGVGERLLSLPECSRHLQGQFLGGCSLRFSFEKDPVASVLDS
jgi:hypothetical protein